MLFGALLGSGPAAATEKLGEEFRVNGATANAQFTDFIYTTARHAAWAADGSFVVVHGSDGQDGDGEGVFARRFSADGTPEGPEFQVNQTADLNQEGGTIGGAPDGSTFIAWFSNHDPGGGHAIFGRRYDGAGNPLGGEFQVSDPSPGPEVVPKVSVAPDGRALVSWEDSGRDGSLYGVFGRLFDSAGSPVGGEFQVNQHATNQQIGHSSAMDADANFIVAWESWDPSQDGSATAVLARLYFADGTPRTDEFVVHEFTAGVQHQASVAMNATGDSVVAWVSRSQDGDGGGIFARRFDPAGNPLGPEFQVNVETDGDQASPSASLADDGGLVVTWASPSQDGSGWGIFGRYFDAADSSPCGEFQVNSHSAGDQTWPDVSFRPDGGFTALWTSDGQDGDDLGVYAQRFGTGLPASTQMPCFAANCSKLGLGSGSGDGKVTMQGSFALASCTGDGSPFPPLEAGDTLRVSVDGTVVFEQPLSAFSQKGSQLQFRQGAVRMILDLDRLSFKLTDRRSDLAPGDVSPEDGVLHRLEIGSHVGEELVDMVPAHDGLSSCRHGQDVVSCGD